MTRQELEDAKEFAEYALTALGADNEHGIHGPWYVSGPYAKRLYWIVRREEQRILRSIRARIDQDERVGKAPAGGA